MEQLKLAVIKTFKTGIETMLGFITIGMTPIEVEWLYALSVTAVAMLVTFLWNIVSLLEELINKSASETEDFNESDDSEYYEDA